MYNYNDDLTGKLIDICRQENANKNWFWLVHVDGTEEKGVMYITESGNLYNVTEYTKKNFNEKAVEFAKKIPVTY
jgi:hypothetical protein